MCSELVLRKKSVFRDGINPIYKYNDAVLLCKFRYSRHHILSLTDVFENQLVNSNRVGALPTVLQVYVLSIKVLIHRLSRCLLAIVKCEPANNTKDHKCCDTSSAQSYDTVD